MARYADIILPLSLGQPLTYSIPEGITISAGDGVVVSMGRSSEQLYTAIVWRVHDTPPPYKRVKSIIKKVYSIALVSDSQRLFWEWIASYYLCSLGEVMRVALPSLIKPRAKSEEEFEQMQFQPRKEIFISLETCDSQTLIDKIPLRAKAKRRALESIITATKECHTEALPRRIIDESSTILRSLEQMKVIKLEERECSISSPIFDSYSLPKLTPIQKEANEAINSVFSTKSTALLHGVTGSGKSEIYMHQIATALEQGGDVLLLLPEIALTAQLVERMERVFGARVSLYHSLLSAKTRTELYLKLSSSEGGNLVIGARSAILLPLKELKLIIVDEEHDSSYKQQEPAPRYNARDCAVLYSSMSGAKTLLGSATPSLESYANAQSGKYGYITLNQRYNNSQMAEIVISDTLRSVKRGERRSHLNLELKLSLEECTKRGEQAILFQNRRGVAPYVECKECGYTPKCPNCNVSMTLHSTYLECHYCATRESVPTSCPECGAESIKAMGFGTERIEERIKEMMPDSSIARLDADIATSQGRLRGVVGSFERGETDILIGTQMVTKGFDFAGVTLIGVLNADNLLLAPDFRAEERAFQLLTQIAGRAGRRKKPSKVIIQSSQPKHRILQFVKNGSYEAMASELLNERAMFHYPPYARIIEITMRHTSREHLIKGASKLAQHLRDIFARRVLGPSSPPVDRVRGEYIEKITLKIELGKSSTKARELLTIKLGELSKEEWIKGIKISCDVDPI